MTALRFQIWRGSTKVKEIECEGPLTREEALGALQVENSLWLGKLTVKDSQVGLRGPRKLDSSKTYVLRLADLAGTAGGDLSTCVSCAEPCTRTPVLMLPSWLPSWLQWLFTSVMPTVPVSNESGAKALSQRMEQRLDHPVVSPQARQLVEDSSSVILVDSIPGSKRKRNEEKVQSGMGFFYGFHTALSWAHTLPDNLLQEGKAIQAVEKDTKSPNGMSKTSLQVRDFDREMDWVRLTAKSKHTFVPIFQGPTEDLLGASLGLCSFPILLHQELSEPLSRIGIAPGVGLRVSHNARHLLYSCPSWGGDSGAAVLLYKGQIAAMHQVDQVGARDFVNVLCYCTAPHCASECFWEGGLGFREACVIRVSDVGYDPPY
ncbi:hypothetical protein WJX74_001331 [Apatococcus lobatus]|uniref:Uncharacterized protein n=1 Tax=Apatococcus lobatus TaxID=904363 RepID=A0AAW1S1N5_9CHLO